MKQSTRDLLATLDEKMNQVARSAASNCITVGKGNLDSITAINIIRHIGDCDQFAEEEACAITNAICKKLGILHAY